MDVAVGKNLNYSTAERRFLRNRKVMAAVDSACVYCYRCSGQCPNAVDLPAMLRIHSYISQYRNFSQANDTLRQLDRIQPGSIKRCISCNRCTVRCARNVNVAGRMDEIMTVLGSQIG